MYGKYSELYDLGDRKAQKIYGKKAYYTAPSKWSCNKEYRIVDFKCFDNKLAELIAFSYEGIND